MTSVRLSTFCVGMPTHISWLPLFHDMGLVGNLMQPLFVGAFTVLMPPTTFLERPIRWFQAITRYRPYTTGAPNFAYALSLRSISAEDRATFDLGSLRNLYVGAEPIDAALMRRFMATFADCGLRSASMLACYGMAETTLLSTCGGPRMDPVFLSVAPAPPRAGHENVAATQARSRALVGCGGWGEEQALLIVDPETRQPVADGLEGEIWISGWYATVSCSSQAASRTSSSSAARTSIRATSSEPWRRVIPTSSRTPAPCSASRPTAKTLLTFEPDKMRDRFNAAVGRARA